MNYSRPWMFCGLALMVAGAVLLWRQGNFSAGQLAAEQVAEDAPKDRETDRAESRQKESPPTAWKKLFDGKTLKGWKATQFGGEGKVHVRDGAIVMEMGGMMTGITWTGKPPRNNYELALEGIRLDGSDFFCTTTFPVGDEHCSLVVGGWGGILVGLSNVDRFDASENQTTTTFDFEEKKWYRVRVRVTDAAIEAWIDDNRVVNQPRKGHTFGIRDEVDLCRPLGICTWCTKGAVRNIRLRELRRVGQAKRSPTSGGE
ncbi:MAG: DUF1080 domain-containing protein [Planctomycetales bacterium]|nr:DUF1080 domain-containing protein [Planctomycetales bacterium]